jgi:uncharacterized small protein (DUF1192 family)
VRQDWINGDREIASRVARLTIEVERLKAKWLVPMAMVAQTCWSAPTALIGRHPHFAGICAGFAALNLDSPEAA